MILPRDILSLSVCEGEAFRDATRDADASRTLLHNRNSVLPCSTRSNRVAKASIPYGVCPPTGVRFELQLAQEVKLLLIHTLGSTTRGCMAETADFATFRPSYV